MMAARAFIPLAAILALAACAPQQAIQVPPDVAKTIHVNRVRVQYAAAFAPGTSDMQPGEPARLETFLDQTGTQPGDKVFLAASSGDPLASARTGRIAALLARHGLGVEPVAPPEGVEPNHVLVLVDRYVAMAPACPDWSQEAWGDHDNEPSSNFGCATATDFALMIANPRDLVQGRALGPADGDPAADAVMRYRTGTVKALSGASASSGAGSGTSSSSSGMSGGGAPPAPPPSQ